MNILMATNTFTPLVGGVTRSICLFAEEFRRRGENVLVLAPVYDDAPEHEPGVLRLPALQRFNGSDFSVVLTPAPGLTQRVDEFRPDLIHSHHPFLLGSTAARLARHFGVPLVYTHHTRYEEYTHYVPGHLKAMRRFAEELSANYANLCSMVFAPSESVASLLEQRGVIAPISVVPTGIRLDSFEVGDGAAFRSVVGIPQDAFVVGHVGRLAPEKNLAFLTQALLAFLKSDPTAYALIVGNGVSRLGIEEAVAAAGLSERVCLTGTLQPPLLTSAYKAMDVFAFASHSETQGLVLTEAMAAGVPVVAVDASGVREVVRHRRNGLLLDTADREAFVKGLSWVANLPRAEVLRLQAAARATAGEFAIEKTADLALDAYRGLAAAPAAKKPFDFAMWDRSARRLGIEWELASAAATAASRALLDSVTHP